MMEIWSSSFGWLVEQSGKLKPNIIPNIMTKY